MLYELGIPFRHDYEVVISQVIDFVEQRPEIDNTRLAIIGRSFGGYLAPRAASIELDWPRSPPIRRRRTCSRRSLSASRPRGSTS